MTEPITLKQFADLMDRDAIVEHAAKMLTQPNPLYEALLENYHPEPRPWFERLRSWLGDILIRAGCALSGRHEQDYD